MRIERVTRYEVDGEEFKTLAKAQDYIDGKIHYLMQNNIKASPNNMITDNDIIRITEILIENRQYLAYLLSVELPEDDE